MNELEIKQAETVTGLDVEADSSVDEARTAEVSETGSNKNEPYLFEQMKVIFYQQRLERAPLYGNNDNSNNLSNMLVFDLNISIL